MRALSITLLVLLLLPLYVYCFGRVVQKSRSPSGKYEAVERVDYEMNAGSRHTLLVREVGAPRKPDPNVRCEISKKSIASFHLKRKQDVALLWKSDTHLTVELPVNTDTDPIISSSHCAGYEPVEVSIVVLTTNRRPADG